MKAKVLIVLTLLGMLLVMSLSALPATAPSYGDQHESLDSELRAQLSEIYQQKNALTPVQRKIDWNLMQTVRQVEERVLAAGHGETLTLEDLSTAMLKIDDQGMIEVKLTVADLTADEIEQLEALDMSIRVTLPEYGIVEGNLPYHRVEAVAGLDFVTRVGTPGYAIHNVGDVTTEGDAVLGAFEARQAFGVDGSGVKVGVISDGVSHLSDSVASGDLPSSPAVEVLQAGLGDEGTAMLEIVHDLAPGSALAFYSPNTSSDMVSGISALEAAGCNIVVDDLGFADEPKFEDGPIAQEARRFCDDGGVYVTAAGNDAQSHYFHAYNPAYDPTWQLYAHNYASSGTDTENNFNIPDGAVIVVILQWNNRWGQSADDFDILLLDTQSNILALSANWQDGDDDPFEWFAYYNDTESSIAASLVVPEWDLVSPPSSLVLDYHVWYAPSPLEYATAQNSVIGHQAVSEVLSVAAADAATPDMIEDSSSRGPGTVYFPTYEERQVPNITGVDGVQTKTGQLGHFPNPFYGTSAAAPHVAGVAALVWEADPTLTSSQVSDAIMSTAVAISPTGIHSGFGRADAAVDISSTAWDIHSGFGRADAYAAVESVLADSSDLATRDLPDGVDMDETFAVHIDIVNLQFGQVVETLPPGFTYVSVAPGAGMDGVSASEADGVVTFTFLATTGAGGSFSYQVTAPGAPVVGAEFSGILRGAGQPPPEWAVGGDQTMDVGWTPCSYDVNENDVIDIDEVLAAIVDYFADPPVIDISQVLEVITLYFSGGC